MWRKSGLIFRTAGQRPWMASHGCTPTAFAVDEARFRILFAPRDERGLSIPSYIDVAAENPSEVVEIGEEPIMALGELGTFDDGGIMPCSVVAHEAALYLYYVGWNASVSVPYRNAIGLAVSHDGGRSFERLFKGAIVDRNRDEPFFTASPCVIKDGGLWRLWYASTIGFLTVEGRPEPIYVLKDAVSDNGIDWRRSGREILPQAHPEEAIARPSVLKDGGRYEMWFCHRGSRDFRDGADSYRLGYAVSKDGETWHRDDARAGLAKDGAIFDAAMQTYPNVIAHKGRLHLFYNGNGFGREGICHAEWSA